MNIEIEANVSIVEYVVMGITTDFVNFYYYHTFLYFYYYHTFIPLKSLMRLVLLFSPFYTSGN